MKERDKIAPNKNQASVRQDTHSRSIISRTLIVFLPIFLIILTTSLLILMTKERVEKLVYLSTEERLVDTKLENIETEINHVINDLLILSLNSRLETLWEDADHPELIKALTRDFLNVAVYHKIYDQVRLIDENGTEIIRVNYNNGHPVVVPQQKLQNKKDRYYFTETFKLNRNEVFVSPIDLNIENGKIEQPIKPMIRFATPVFDRQGIKRGIVIFNYFGETILSQIDNHVNSKVESQVMLLNADGYWLKGSVPENEWGFMYEDKKHLTFSRLYPDIWSRIKNEDASQFETPQGLYTFKTIYPLLEGQKSGKGTELASSLSETQLMSSDYYWKIISYVPSEVLYSERNKLRKQLVLLLAFLSMGLFFISWKLARAQYYRREALQSLKISNETKDKFFSIISHDLKSPFNSLLGFTDLLLQNYDTFDDAERKHIIESLNTSSKNTYQLLENLLTWSRSQTGRIEFSPQEIEVKTLIYEIILLSQPAAENKSIVLSDHTEADLSVYADKSMLQSVLRNLISNAIKFTGNKGSVSVSAKKSKQDRFIEISISDTGVGIPEDIIDDLFRIDKNRSRPGTEKEKGTGLGLILCKEFVEKQGGQIWIESEVGKGSQFIFTLPEVL